MILKWNITQVADTLSRAYLPETKDEIGDYDSACHQNAYIDGHETMVPKHLSISPEKLWMQCYRIADNTKPSCNTSNKDGLHQKRKYRVQYAHTGITNMLYISNGLVFKGT